MRILSSLIASVALLFATSCCSDGAITKYYNPNVNGGLFGKQLTVQNQNDDDDSDSPTAKYVNLGTFDFVQVGLGTAGCIVAEKLSRPDRAFTVLGIDTGVD